MNLKEILQGLGKGLEADTQKPPALFLQRSFLLLTGLLFGLCASTPASSALPFTGQNNTTAVPELTGGKERQFFARYIAKVLESGFSGSSVPLPRLAGAGAGAGTGGGGMDG